MSVQVNNYIMIGSIYEYKEFNELIARYNKIAADEDCFEIFDFIEPYFDSPFRGIEHHNGLCVLSDGMSGKYQAVGQVLYKGKDWEPSVSPRPIDLTKIEQDRELKAHVTRLIIRQLNIPRPVVKTLFISHSR